MSAGRTIPLRESLTVEFKSDARRLSDDELVRAAVCMANTDGGDIYVGVEDDGRVTGLHPAHHDVQGLAALIANRTTPPLSLRVERQTDGRHVIARIEVPRSPRIVATTDGVTLRRRLQADGQPECVPFLPHEFAARQSEFGLVDPSAFVIRAASVDDFDPDERKRLRRAIERFGGDRALLKLEDAEFDAALGFVKRDEGKLHPSVAGLLFLGTEMALRDHIPSHEVAFQVLEGTRVKVNEFMRGPLLRAFERVEDLFSARVTEHELQLGLFRVPVPTVDKRAFREAVANALTHRDYARLGAAHIRWEPETVTVSNPGGFVEGVTLENLLVVEPHPRNPLLADAFKRIGIVERTGRGVDLIYEGMLRYGRPAPDYSMSNPTSVVLKMSTVEPDLPFFALILDYEQRTGGTLPIDSLLALSLFREERRVDLHRVAQVLQKDDGAARRVLERLVEAGLVSAAGVKKGRTYTLSPTVYRHLGRGADYVRQTAFDALQQEQMVLKFVATHGQIRRRDAIALCQVSESQATRLLGRLVEEGHLRPKGTGKGTIYVRNEKIQSRT